MKKILLATLLIGMMGSCVQPNVKTENTKYVLFTGHNPLQIIVIDSCQYLLGDWGNATVLTHKGNCSNPIHKGGVK